MAINAYDGDSDYYIKAKELTKVYYDGLAAVLDTSFAIKKGEVLGLLGPNGAGKSTTFNMITMDLRRTKGDIKLNN